MAMGQRPIAIPAAWRLCMKLAALRGASSAPKQRGGGACSWMESTELGRMCGRGAMRNSATGTRTRVARVRAEYPSQLDYSGSCDSGRSKHRRRSTCSRPLRTGNVHHQLTSRSWETGGVVSPVPSCSGCLLCVLDPAGPLCGAARLLLIPPPGLEPGSPG